MVFELQQDDCFVNQLQDFLVCTTVHKARHVRTTTSELYVRVQLNKMSKHTKYYSNSENPYFNEYFVFEQQCTLAELLRQTILYELKKRSNCKKSMVVGELIIDMQTVWNQTNHCYFKKWGRLETPISVMNTPTEDESQGYLQIDLAIVTHFTHPGNIIRPDDQEAITAKQWQAEQNFDDINSNMLHHTSEQNANNIRYYISCYRGNFVKKCDYLIQVSFAGIHSKTPIVKATTNPVWNEQIHFAWVFPSVAQMFHVQVYAHEHLIWRRVAETELNLEEIAFNDKPSFGPTYMHFYDTTNAIQYVGRLLFELHSEMLDTVPARMLLREEIHALDVTRYWEEELFRLELLPIQGICLQPNGSNCKITLSFGEYTSKPVEATLEEFQGSFKLPCTAKYFKLHPPYKCCRLVARLPDHRYKYDSDFFMLELVNYMKSELNNFHIFQLKYPNEIRQHSKCLKAVLLGILNKVKTGVQKQRLEFETTYQRTNWDINRQLYLIDFFVKFPVDIRNLRNKLKVLRLEYLELVIEEIVQQLLRHISELKILLVITRLQDEWPDLLIKLNAGGRAHVCRLNSKHFLNMNNPNINNDCFEIKTFIFKDSLCNHSCKHCGCIRAEITGCLGIYNDIESKDFLKNIANRWKLNENSLWMPTLPPQNYNCRVFVHQAKIRPFYDITGLCDSHLRIYFCDKVVESYTMPATLSPIWNVVMTLPNVQLPGTASWYSKNPMHVLLEIYDLNFMQSTVYIGCGFIDTTIFQTEKERKKSLGSKSGLSSTTCSSGFIGFSNPLGKLEGLKYLSPPTLRWAPISFEGSVRAEVLISAELTEATLDATNKQIAPTLSTGIPLAIKPNLMNYVLEVVFVGLRNYTKSVVSLAGKRRIKVMMADLVLSSGLSTSPINNSINFLVSYASGVVILPDQQEFWPGIIATDVEVSGSGSVEYTVGAALIPNTRNFLQRKTTLTCKPIPDHDRTVIPMDYDERSATESVTQSDASSNASRTAGGGDTTETTSLYNKPPRATLCRAVCVRFRAFAGLSTHTAPRLRALNNDMDETLINEQDYSWWTKFYHSTMLPLSEDHQVRKHSLEVYNTELENCTEFNKLQDWAIPVPLVHGLKYQNNVMTREDVYATLKLSLKLTPCQCGHGSFGDCGQNALRPLAVTMNPKYQASAQMFNELCSVKVRIYVVQGLQLRPRTMGDDMVAYIKLNLGSKSITDRAIYQPNAFNPIFGKSYDLDCMIPREHVLKVTLMDRNKLCDVVVGSTSIDLENRWRSKYRATIGIAKEYTSAGYNKWRDVRTPYDILTDLCIKREISLPHFFGHVVEVDGIIFRDETVLEKNEDLVQRLSLTVLRNLHELPSFEYNLVPEHVETRSLYREEAPGIEQGKIQLWIELYDGVSFIPQPIDITPYPPIKYQLRIVIREVKDIELKDVNLFGATMSDVYVECWCHNVDQKQRTDIHYRSTGDASFNWRMIFDIEYSPAEDMLVWRRRGSHNHIFDVRYPPILNFQIWDKDLLSPDDFLASMELHLSHLPEPHTHWHNFDVNFHRYRRRVNIFHKKNVHGWFAMKAPEKERIDDEYRLAGKIELELEMLTATEAVEKSAGKGRDPPDALPPPKRSSSSFNPLTHPFKAFRKIFWPHIRKYVYFTIFCIIAFFAAVRFLSGLPADIWDALTKP